MVKRGYGDELLSQGKGGKRREVPIWRDLAQVLRLHIGCRRAAPLLASRQRISAPCRKP